MTPLTASAQNYGGIDIGSRGIKRIVLSIEPGKVPTPVANSESSVNLGLEKSLKASTDGTGQFFEMEELDNAVRIIKSHVSEMTTKFGVPNDKKHIFVVVSSGLAEAASKNDPNKDAPANSKAITQLKRKLLSALSAEINEIGVISAADEAKLTFAAIPQIDSSASFSVDVGGGNTKLSNGVAGDAVPFGTSTLQTPLENAQTPQDRQAIVDNVAKSVLVAIDKLKSKEKVQSIYVSGGAAYILSLLANPDKIAEDPKGNHHFSWELLKSTIGDIEQAIEKNVSIEDLFDSASAQATPDGKKLLASAKNIYRLPQLHAGTIILRECVEKLQKDNPDAKVTFFGDGQTAWIRQYIVSKIKIDPVDLESLHNMLKDRDRRIEQLEKSGPQTPTSYNLTEEQVKQIVTKLSNLDNLKKLEDIEANLSSISTHAASTTQQLKEISNKLDKLPTHPYSTDNGDKSSLAASSTSRFHFGTGINAGRARDWQTAIENFQKTIDLDPSNAVAWYYLGLCHLQLGDETNATPAIKQAGRLIGNDSAKLTDIRITVQHIQGSTRQKAEKFLLQGRLSR